MWETKYINKCNPGTMMNTVRENDKLLWDSIMVNLIRLGWGGRRFCGSGKVPSGNDIWPEGELDLLR